MSYTWPHNMVNFGPVAAEIDPVVWGTPANSVGFTSWQRYCTASSSGRQPNFAALNRRRHLCSAWRPSRWALAHILVFRVLQYSLLTVHICPLLRCCYLCHGRCVVAVVCLFVSDFAQKNFQTDLHEILREGWQWASEQMVKFSWRSGSPSGCRGCFPDSSLLGNTEIDYYQT